LQWAHDGRFPDTQIRILQRRIKQWRSTRAREFVFGDLRIAAADGMHQTRIPSLLVGGQEKAAP
jgi:hypothetical protein